MPTTTQDAASRPRDRWSYACVCGGTFPSKGMLRQHLDAHWEEPSHKAVAATPPDAPVPTEQPHDVRYFVNGLARAAELLGKQEGLDTILLATAHLLNHYAEQARLAATPPDASVPAEHRPLTEAERSAAMLAAGVDMNSSNQHVHDLAVMLVRYEATLRSIAAPAPTSAERTDAERALYQLALATVESRHTETRAHGRSSMYRVLGTRSWFDTPDAAVKEWLRTATARHAAPEGA